MKCHNVWVENSLFPPSQAPACQQWCFRVQISHRIKSYQHQEGDAKWFFSSVTQSCPTLCDPMDCSTPGFPVHQQHTELAQLMSIESVMPSNHLILCCPFLLLPSVFPSITFSILQCLSESTTCERLRESRSLGQPWPIRFFDKNSWRLKYCLIVVFHTGKGTLGFLGGSDRKESACSVGDLGSIPGLGRSPGVGHDNPLQYSCLKNPMDRGAWLQSMRTQRVRHNWRTKRRTQYIKIH